LNVPDSHANAGGSTWSDAQGIETEVYLIIKEGSETYTVAKEVQPELIKATGLTNRGVKEAISTHGTRNTNASYPSGTSIHDQ
jgi:N-acetylmuramoyl-L-alanine amidase